MSDFFSLSQLRNRFGDERVIDVLSGTNLEAGAAENKYGIFLIRGAVSDHGKWAPLIDNMFEKINENGVSRRKSRAKDRTKAITPRYRQSPLLVSASMITRERKGILL